MGIIGKFGFGTWDSSWLDFERLLVIVSFVIYPNWPNGDARLC